MSEIKPRNGEDVLCKFKNGNFMVCRYEQRDGQDVFSMPSGWFASDNAYWPYGNVDTWWRCDALEAAEARAEKAEADAKEWKEQIPEECPITGLPYFNSFKTSAGVYQPFYGGPCDVYGIPYKDEDGYLCRKRLCLDSMREEDENMCLEVVEEERMIDLEQAEARAEELEEYIAKLVCELTDGKLSKPYDISVITDEVESIYRAYAEDEIAKATAKTEAENARLRAELETAKQVAASAQAVAQEVWAGEIPSPLPGHKRANEEESLAQVEHLNCPLCGGSGHVDDCDHDSTEAIARLTKERDWLADVLHRHDPHRFDIEYWKSNARRAVATPPTTEAVSIPCPICGGSGHIGDCEED